jgi:phage terminase large subunit
MKQIDKPINPAFNHFIFDWDYKQYVVFGGYGSSKSYNTAFKIILKCLTEKRKVLVVREVYETIKESCYDLFEEILDGLDILSEDNTKEGRTNKVVAKKSPLEFIFPNGSRIIFKGMDKVNKIKSINGVSIVWLEEAAEIKYAAYKELLGRLRTPEVSIHFILSFNPVEENSWVYKHFFVRENEDGKEIVIQDPEELYEKRQLVKNNIYYHHSTPDDNCFLNKDYIKTLDELKDYDIDLYRVARLGRFGINGTKVLPQIEIASNPRLFKNAVKSIERKFKFVGMDFGFETSYNAVIKMAVDDKRKWLYIYKEYYKNKMTDDNTAIELLEWDDKIVDEQIHADCAEPKTIKFYQQTGFKMKGAKKYTRIEQTKKIKRFKKIIISPACKNTKRELQTLVYKTDPKGNIIYDEFNIDPHTLSAIWYGLEDYQVADVKEKPRNSR